MCDTIKRMTPGDSNKREASASSSRIVHEAAQLSSFISDKKKKTVSWANNATYKYVDCVDPTDSFVSGDGLDSLQDMVGLQKSVPHLADHLVPQ